MSRLRFTILGCGSSGGVPRIGNVWGACDPENPKNRRLRCSMLVERISREGITRALIDTGPDMREQLLRADVGTLDGVVYTHSHADHIHGLDDLRQIAFVTKRRLPVWADSDTEAALISRFGYAFVQPPDSNYHPICDLLAIRGPFEVNGPGGPIPFVPFRVEHGNIDALGFRIGGLIYLPDVSDIPEEAEPLLDSPDCFVIDCLRYKPHPTHFNMDQALAWIERSNAASAVLTNLHIDLDYETVAAETPENVRPAYDGLVLEFPAP